MAWPAGLDGGSGDRRPALAVVVAVDRRDIALRRGVMTSFGFLVASFPVRGTKKGYWSKRMAGINAGR